MLGSDLTARGSGFGPFVLLLALVLSACATERAVTAKPEPVTIEIDEAAAAKRLSLAIQIETVTQDSGAPAADAFDQLHRFLESSYPLVARTLERQVVLEHALLYRWAGADPQLAPIVLTAHMDVVPADYAAWSPSPVPKKPFEGEIWGRGTLDDKLSVLGLMEAVEYLLAAGERPQRTTYLAFGHDEERDGTGAAAIAQLLEDQGLRPLFVLDEGSVIGEGLVPGVEKPVAMVGLAEKGYLSLELTARSASTGSGPGAAAKGGHSSMPPPNTPIVQLARGLQALADNPMPSDLRSPVSEMLTTLAPEMSFLERVVMGNLWLFEPLVAHKLAAAPESNAMIRTTGVPTVVRGGDKENSIPQKARAVVNYRILPGDSVAAVSEHVENLVAEAGLQVKVLGTAIEPSPVSPANSDSFALLQQSILEVFPDVVVAPALVVAATDGRHYTGLTPNVYRFLPVKLDADRLAGIHGVDERISEDAYGDVIRFYIRLITNAAL